MMIDIKKATPDDFPEFNTTFPQAEEGVAEFARATNSEEACYLLARDDNRVLVGKLYLNFSGVTYPEIREKISGCPDLENIEVLPSHRGRGVGTQLILEAEKICKERGFSRVGLGVAVDNPQAQKLYEGLGYQDTELGEFEISFTWRSQPGGPEQVINEKIVYLVKIL